MIKLIASDLDGTMFEKGNVIPETNLKAINDINNSQEKHIPYLKIYVKI